MMVSHISFLRQFSNHLQKFYFYFELISGLMEDSQGFHRSIVIWNPLETDKTKQKRFLPLKHRCRQTSLSFSPDGRFLASANEKGEIIIWSTEVRNWVNDVSLDVCGALLPIYEQRFNE